MLFCHYLGVFLFKVEEEINNQLLEGSPPSFIAEYLFEKISSDSSQIDQTNLQAFYFFLIRAGRLDLLLYFFQKQVYSENFHWHRGYFNYALLKAFPEDDEDLKEIILASLNNQDSEQFWIEAATTKIADKLLPEIKPYRKKIKEFYRKKYNKKRSDLIQKFILFQSQQLTEPAKKLIRKLEKSYPHDEEIKKLSHTYHEVDAQAVFDKYKFKERSIIKKPKNEPEVETAKQNLEKNLLQDLEKYKENYQDLVILCLQLESHEAALAIIRQFQNELRSVWLLVEVLIKNNRYLEVLNILPIIEKSLAHEPETFFATTYCRAICYWGLGERNSALEVLEGLINSQPNYRASEVLLEEWRKL